MKNGVQTSKNYSLAVNVDYSKPTLIFTNEDLLKQLGNSVDVNINAENLKISIGYALSSDLSSYCYQKCDYIISSKDDGDLKIGEKTWNDSSELNNNLDGSNTVDYSKITLKTSDDIFVNSVVENNNASFSWLNENNSFWSMLFIIESAQIDVATTTQKSDVVHQANIEFRWDSSISNFIILPCLFASFLLIIIFILILVFTSSNRRNGSHVGDHKPIKQIINSNNGFSMPTEVKITNAKDFSRNNSSILSDISSINQGNNYFKSQIDDNNLANSQDIMDLFLNNPNSFNATDSIKPGNSNPHLAGFSRQDLRKIKKSIKKGGYEDEK